MTKTVKLFVAAIICLIVMLWPVHDLFIIGLFMLDGFYFWFMNIAKFLSFILFWWFSILLITDAIKHRKG